MLINLVFIAITSLSHANAMTADDAKDCIELLSSGQQLAETPSSLDDLRSMINETGLTLAELKYNFKQRPKATVADYDELAADFEETEGNLNQLRELLESNPSFARSASLYVNLQVMKLQRKVNFSPAKTSTNVDVRNNDIRFWSQPKRFGGPGGLPPK